MKIKDYIISFLLVAIIAAAALCAASALGGCATTGPDAVEPLPIHLYD